MNQLLTALLNLAFPNHASKAFSPEEMRSIMEYQYRLSRTGCDPTGYTVGARVTRVTEGEYVYVDEKPADLHYSDDERIRVAIYPVNDPELLALETETKQVCAA